MSHTPGPWEPQSDARGWYIIGPMVGDGNVVATVELNSEANARLIAAAPGLLALLQDFIAEGSSDEMCRFCDDESWYGEGHSSSCLIGNAQAVVAKAVQS